MPISRLTTCLLAAVIFSATFRGSARAQHAPQPTAVNVRLRNEPARQAYVELSKQAGVRMGYVFGQPADDRKLSLNLVHEPFWDAMTRLRASSGLEIAWVRRIPRAEIALVPGIYQRDRQTVGTAVDGAFIASMDDRTSDADRRAPHDPTKLVATTLSIKLWAEPRYRALHWHAITIEELTDETGRPIDRKPIPRNIACRDGLGYLILNLAERPWPRRIGKLVITSKVVTAVKSDLLEISDLSRDEIPAFEAGGFRIFGQSREIAKGRNLTLNLTPTRDVPEWMRLNGSLYLFEPFGFDKSGRRLNTLMSKREVAGRDISLQMDVTMPDRRPTDPAYGSPEKLLMDLPTEIVDHDVRLEFTDVKLH